MVQIRLFSNFWTKNVNLAWLGFTRIFWSNSIFYASFWVHSGTEIFQKVFVLKQNKKEGSSEQETKYSMQGMVNDQIDKHFQFYIQELSLSSFHKPFVSENCLVDTLDGEAYLRENFLLFVWTFVKNRKSNIVELLQTQKQPM